MKTRSMRKLFSLLFAVMVLASFSLSAQSDAHPIYYKGKQKNLTKDQQGPLYALYDDYLERAPVYFPPDIYLKESKKVAKKIKKKNLLSEIEKSYQVDISADRDDMNIHVALDAPPDGLVYLEMVDKKGNKVYSAIINCRTQDCLDLSFRKYNSGKYKLNFYTDVASKTLFKSFKILKYDAFWYS